MVNINYKIQLRYNMAIIVKITKHPNPKFIGLIGKVDDLNKPYPLVKFKNGEVECFKLNLEKTTGELSEIPINYARRKGNFEVKGVGEPKELAIDFIDIFSNTEDTKHFP